MRYLWVFSILRTICFQDACLNMYMYTPLYDYWWFSGTYEWGKKKYKPSWIKWTELILTIALFTFWRALVTCFLPFQAFESIHQQTAPIVFICIPNGNLLYLSNSVCALHCCILEYFGKKCVCVCVAGRENKKFCRINKGRVKTWYTQFHV